MSINPGFDPKEIEQLRKECKEEEQNFVLVLDDVELSDSGEYYQFQFVGKHDEKEVIYDAAIFTLELHYNGVLLEEAEKRVTAVHKGFVPIEEREDDYVPNHKADELIEEFIMEMEEDEDMKVSEFVNIDPDFEFGIGLEVAVNAELITLEDIGRFVDDFNVGTFKLDNNRFSFKQELGE
ncbi:MAG: hypothetical protein ACI9QN_001061 [Arcticibacterium sp.]|jgi:hypothetical protein